MKISMIKWCRKCVLLIHDLIKFDKHGVCNACRQSQTKINWQDRKNQFIGLIEKVKKKEYL